MKSKKITPLKLSSPPKKAPYLLKETLKAQVTALMEKYTDDSQYGLGKRSAYNDVLLLIEGKPID